MDKFDMKSILIILTTVTLAAVTLATVTLATVTLSSCIYENNSDRRQEVKTEKLIQSGNLLVSMPNITNFTEKRFAKLIYELKDTEVATFSYFMDMSGGLHFLCESVGYGMPSSVQYVNPGKVLSRSTGVTTIPQAEPNGLFMPEGLDATFVLCSDGVGVIRPVYSEPKLIVSPFKLNHTSELRAG